MKAKKFQQIVKKIIFLILKSKVSQMKMKDEYLYKPRLKASIELSLNSSTSCGYL